MTTLPLQIEVIDEILLSVMQSRNSLLTDVISVGPILRVTASSDCDKTVAQRVIT